MSETQNQFNVKTAEATTISNNVAEDIIKYSRGNVIRNEQQAYILMLAWTTGWMGDEDDYVNIVTVGSPSGGKTKMNRTMKELLPDNSYYSATDVSEAGIYNDADKWNSKKLGVFSEFQKLSDSVKEVIKSLNGGDGGASRTKSVQTEDGDWESDDDELESKPYSFTYAQSSQSPLGQEVADRLFFNYIEEALEINKAVVKKHSGHSNISLSTDDGIEYVYDAKDTELALKRHFRSIPEDSYTMMPEWCYYAYEDCLDMKRTDVKRTGNILPNLIRASTLQNYKHRPTIDDDIGGKAIERYVVLPQDVANVLSCRETLLGTTHDYALKKRSIVNAVRAHTEMSDWCSINDIQNWLRTNSTEVSKLKKGPLKELLESLSEDFVIEISTNHFDNKKDGYRFLSLSDVGAPKLNGFNESRIDYNSDNPLLGVDDPDNPFKNCVDPFKGIPFTDSVEERQQSLRRSINTSASDTMSSSNSGGQSTFGSDEPEELTDPVEIAVYEQVRDNADGIRFEETVEHEQVLGLVDVGDNIAEADFEGTLLDPDHDIWTLQDGSQRANSPSDARKAIEGAFESLFNDGVIEFESNDDGTGTIQVNEVECDELAG